MHRGEAQGTGIKRVVAEGDLILYTRQPRAQRKNDFPRPCTLVKRAKNPIQKADTMAHIRRKAHSNKRNALIYMQIRIKNLFYNLHYIKLQKHNAVTCSFTRAYGMTL